MKENCDTTKELFLQILEEGGLTSLRKIELVEVSERDKDIVKIVEESIDWEKMSSDELLQGIIISKSFNLCSKILETDKLTPTKIMRAAEKRNYEEVFVEMIAEANILKKENLKILIEKTKNSMTVIKASINTRRFDFEEIMSFIKVKKDGGGIPDLDLMVLASKVILWEKTSSDQKLTFLQNFKQIKNVPQLYLINIHKAMLEGIEKTKLKNSTPKKQTQLV